MRKVVFFCAALVFVGAFAAPASAYRGPIAWTDVNLDLDRARYDLGEPITGSVKMRWAELGETDLRPFEECLVYIIAMCLEQGRLKYMIGTETKGGYDWIDVARVRKEGRFSIPFDPPRGEIGPDYTYVLRFRFYDNYGGRVIYGSKETKTFTISR